MTLEIYAFVLAIVGVALLFFAAAVAKKQIVWKTRPVPARRRPWWYQ